MGKQSRLKRQRREAAQREARERESASPDAKDIEARLSKFIETQRDSLDARELEILEELLEAARTTIQLHHAEARERLAAQARGEVITKRWQVAPGVFDRLSAKVIRVIQLRKKLTGKDKALRKAG